MSTSASRPAPSKPCRRRRYTQAQLEAQLAARVRAAERREVLKATAVLTGARAKFQKDIAEKRSGIEEPLLPDPRIISPEQLARLDVKAAVEAGALGLFVCGQGHSLANAAQTPMLLMAPTEWRLCLLCFPESSWPPFPPVPPRSEPGDATHAEALAEDYQRAMVQWQTKRAGIELKYAARSMFPANAIDEEDEENG